MNKISNSIFTSNFTMIFILVLFFQFEQVFAQSQNQSFSQFLLSPEGEVYLILIVLFAMVFGLSPARFVYTKYIKQYVEKGAEEFQRISQRISERMSDAGRKISDRVVG